MNLKRVLLLFPMLVLAISGCNINNEPLGVRRELVGEGDVGNILKTALFSTPDDTSIAVTLNTGSASLLLAGEAQNVTSEFLIAFSKVDSSGIKAAKLVLPIYLVAGAGSAYTPTVHRVLRAWKEDSVLANNLQAPYFDPANGGQARFPALDSLRENVNTDTLYFELDSTFVRSLASDSVNVVIRSLDRDVLFEFHSRQSFDRVPVLELVQSRTGRPDTTLRFTARADAYVFRREVPLPNDRFYVSNTERYETYLRFTPLDSIPANATINRANLRLNIDRDHTFITSDGLSCTIFLVDTVNRGADSLSFDLRFPGTGISRVIGKADLTAEFSLTGTVQGWLIAPEFNVGLAIEPGTPTRDLQRAAFHTATSNAALSPVLTIDYTTPPTVE
ncbi:MAG: DNRLRE domain-containing protein [bacterium]